MTAIKTRFVRTYTELALDAIVKHEQFFWHRYVDMLVAIALYFEDKPRVSYALNMLTFELDDMGRRAFNRIINP